MDPVRRAGESDLHYDARLLLQRDGNDVAEVLHVAPDAIVFRDRARVVRTGWIYLQGTLARTFVERGMPAEPAIDLPPASPAAVQPDDPPEYDDA